VITDYLDAVTMSFSIESLPPSLAKIVQRFQRATDQKRRYEQLIWYGTKLNPLTEADKVPENKVPGCVSQVFITAALNDGKVIFSGDSDSQLTKGLVGLLIEGLNGLTPTEIVQLAPDFIQETGLNVSLTPSRANGFYNIFKTMQKKALETEVSN
jgi:cysteine desulfuration protein SufE